EGAKFVCSPPLRPKDHQEELWAGLKQDDLQIVATDHAPFNYKGQKELGKDDFSKIPNGLPSVEDRYTLIFQGVHDGRIGLNRFVQLVATAPAKMFGLYPRKGTIAPGSDADIVVFEPNHPPVECRTCSGGGCRRRDPTRSTRAATPRPARPPRGSRTRRRRRSTGPSEPPPTPSPPGPTRPCRTGPR